MRTPSDLPISLNARMSPGMSSPILESTKRTQMDAQAYRTMRRVGELERESQSPNPPEVGSLFSGVASMPGTVARRNVTERRSRDRSSIAFREDSKSPEEILRRRSQDRPKDQRRSLGIGVGVSLATQIGQGRRQAEMNQEGWQAEESMDAYPLARVLPRSTFGIPRESPGHFGEEGKFNFQTSVPADPFRQFNLRGDVPDDGLEGYGTPARVDAPSANEGDSDSEDISEDSKEEEEFDLFLRKDIPSMEDNAVVHESLMDLWRVRQAASRELIQALDADDATLFEFLELQMRSINEKMHHILRQYRNEATTFVNVDELPLPDSKKQEVSSMASESSLKKSFKLPGKNSFEITLLYQDERTTRMVHPRSTTMSIYEMAVEYLQQLFLQRVDSVEAEEVFPQYVENVSDIVLLHERAVISMSGYLEDVPVVGGAEIMIIFYAPGERTTKKIYQSDPRSSCPDDGPRGHRQEESHPLQSARALSRPGNNGGAFPPGANHAGYHREESHSLIRARALSRPGNNGGAMFSPDHDQGPSHRGWGESHSLIRARAPSRPDNNGGTMFSPTHVGSSSVGPSPIAYDKIRQSFKCPRFSGQAREWKQWNKGFMRYLSIWDLDHVLMPEFFDDFPLPVTKIRDNKMVYYIIEDSVQNSPLAAAYVRQAQANNGFEAYYTLHDGYVFAGSTTATLLLNELSNFRFLSDESPTALCLRLEELFEELSLLPGDAAVAFTDTQKIGYLINALRHEAEWEVVVSAITSAQIKGNTTFGEACAELRHRCEATRVHELLDKPIKGKKVKGLKAQVIESDGVAELTTQVSALISTMSKRQNVPLPGERKSAKKYVKQECLAAECPHLTTFPLCGLCYHSLISAKIPSLTLRNGYGEAKYDVSTSLIVYPARTPTDRLPSNAPKKTVKAGLASGE
jgi:hypothetical protein